MEKAVLYAMMGDRFLESFDPRSIFAHRILNYKGIEYQLKVMTIPKSEKKLHNAMTHFPMISYQRQIYHDTVDMVSLFQGFNSEISLFDFDPKHEEMMMIMLQWGFGSFALSVKYFLFCAEKNWMRFFEDIKKICETKEELLAVKRERARLRAMIMLSPLSRSDYKNIKQSLFEQMELLESLLKKQSYISGNIFNVSDIAIFSQLHALFHPYIDEAKEAGGRYPNLMNWARDVDNLTSGRFTKKFQG